MLAAPAPSFNARASTGRRSGLVGSRGEVHVPEQVREARVGVEVVPDGVYVQVDQRRESFLDRLPEPRERLILVPQAGVDDCHEVRGDVALLGPLLQLTEHLQRLFPLTPGGVALAERG